MKMPSENTIKKLFALSRNRCAFQGCPTAIVQPTGTITGKVCHIKARNPGGPRYDRGQTDEERNGFENLILLCSVHHDIVDDQPATYTIDLLRDMKEMHERDGNFELSQEDGRLVRKLIDAFLHIEATGEAQVMVASPGGVQAKNLTIKTSSKKVAIPLPPDAIGSNIEMRSYAEYLVKRYIEWRMEGVNTGKDRRRFHPSMIHQLIEREFGARYNLVPQTQFERLVQFLQAAIDETIEGRIKRSRGIRNYHTFEENLEKLRGKKI